LSVMDSENELALRYLPMAVAMARNVKSIPFEDAVQEAAIGLVMGARRFDPERGAAFPTYARYWIAEALQTAAIRALPVHVPLHAAKASHAKRKSDRYAHGDRRPAPEVCPTRVSSVAIEYEDGALIEGVPVHDDREAIDRKMDAMRIVNMLERLPYRQRKALTLYYLDDNATLDTVGAEMGICKEAVRQCIQRGIATLRRQLGITAEGATCR